MLELISVVVRFSGLFSTPDGLSIKYGLGRWSVVSIKHVAQCRTMPLAKCKVDELFDVPRRTIHKLGLYVLYVVGS